MKTPLPFEPEPIDQLIARFPKALEKLWDVEMAEADAHAFRPGELREHIFDFEDEVRCIASRQELPDGREECLISVSYGPDSPRLKSLGNPCDFDIVEAIATATILVKHYILKLVRRVVRLVEVKNGIFYFTFDWSPNDNDETCAGESACEGR